MSILNPYMPDDPIMAGAWISCMQWALGTPEIVEQFRTDTGNNWSPGSTAIAQRIDEATGAEKDFIIQFAKWMNEKVWGEI